MESSEVSLHEVRVYLTFVQNDGWMSARDVESMTDGVAYRTVRAHCAKLAKLGVLDQADVFPGHRYRLAKKARNSSYMQRLRQAVEVFGLATSG